MTNLNPILKQKKGSERHIDVLLNSPEKLNALDKIESIDFHVKEVIAPLKDEHYSEISNVKILEALNLSDHIKELDDFWPRQGHHWDGVALAKDGTVLLIEAKAHISEMDSSPMDDSNSSTANLRIKSLEETAKHLGATFSKDDWTGVKYQTANRLAFAYFLAVKMKKPARVVYIMFQGDKQMSDGEIETTEAWGAKFQEAFRILGLPTDDSESGKKVKSMLRGITVPVDWLYK